MNSTLEQKSGLGVSEPERVEGSEMYKEPYFQFSFGASIKTRVLCILSKYTTMKLQPSPSNRSCTESASTMHNLITSWETHLPTVPHPAPELCKIDSLQQLRYKLGSQLFQMLHNKQPHLWQCKHNTHVLPCIFWGLGFSHLSSIFYEFLIKVLVRAGFISGVEM